MSPGGIDMASLCCAEVILSAKSERLSLLRHEHGTAGGVEVVRTRQEI